MCWKDQEALAGTREALRRNPDAPQRLFDHAQNVFWIGEIARSSGRLRDAETAYREYKSLAERMVSLEPDNMKWRMETQYADTNLGIALFEQRRFAEAEQQFQRALATTQALATADPANSEYQKGLAETLAWLADAKMASGKIGESIALRQRHVALLDRSLAASNDDVEFRQKLIPAYRALGRAYGSRAEFGPAISNLRLAVQHADKLMAVEPQNSLWIEYAADARLDLALYLLTSGNRAEADDEAHSGCRLASSLVYRNGAVGRWRASRRDCDLMLARLAVFGDDKQAALAPARVALEAAKTAKSGDAIADSFAVAEASQLLGDVYAAIGDSENAKTAWEAGLTQLARDSAERPWEMNIRAKLLQRLGRSGEAAPIAAKLSAMKFKSV